MAQNELKILGRFVLGIFEELSDEEVKYIIENNIILVKYVDEYLGNIKRSIKFYTRGYEHRLDEFTSAFVLEWLKESRPDLVKIFKGDIKSVQWLDNNLKAILHYIFGE